MDNYFKIIDSSNIDPKNVLEIGSRDGHHAEAIRRHYNISKVYVVEPNPLKISKIKKRYPNFKIFELAVSNKNEIVDFYQINTGDEYLDGMSSLLNRPNLYNKHKHNKIKVQAITGKLLLDQIQEDIDMCKIDVEGLTYEVLEGFGDDITRIKSFHLETEYNKIWENQKTNEEVTKLLTSYGYIKIHQIVHTTPWGPQYDQIWILKKHTKQQ